MSASPAAAGTAHLELRPGTDGGSTAWLIYHATPGERNGPRVWLDEDGSGAKAFRLFETGQPGGETAGVKAGTGCSLTSHPDSPDLRSVVCAIPSQTSASGARLYLGDGNDRADTFSDLPGTEIFGGAGDDDLEDADRLYGGSGDDILQGGSTATEIHGGVGADTIHGGDGPDTIDPGPDRDIVYSLGDEGKKARDVVRARDGTTDEIYCYRVDRQDRLFVDNLDFVEQCGPPVRSSPAFAVPIDIRPDGEDGRGAIVTLGCWSDGPRVCAGRFTVFARGRILGRDRFRFTRNRSMYLVEVNSRIGRRALLRLRHVRVTLRSRDRRGRLRHISVTLPVFGAAG